MPRSPGVNGVTVYITSQRGMTLIEIMAAGLIITTVVIAIGTGLVMGRGALNNEADAQQALAFAEQKIEELRSKGFGNIIPGDYSDNPEANLSRSWSIVDKSTADRQLKKVTVTVSSIEVPPSFYDVVLTTYVTAYKDAASL